MSRTLPPPAPERAPRDEGGWMARAGLKTLKLAGVAFLRLLLSVVFRGFKSSGAYKEALERARSHSEVRRELGERIQAGWWVSGSLAVDGPCGQARFVTPLVGTRGRGLLRVQARKTQDRWQYDVLEVLVEGSSRPVSLLAPILEGTVIPTSPEIGEGTKGGR